MIAYYDVDGNRTPTYARSEDPESWRIGQDEVGEARVSTVHLSLDHQFDPARAPLIFETMVFGGEQDEWQCRYSTKERAAAGHKATIAWLLDEGPEPEGDYYMTRAEWEAGR